jgi:hypothetical protein
MNMGLMLTILHVLSNLNQIIKRVRNHKNHSGR